MEIALVERRIALGHRSLLGRECPDPARRRAIGSRELTPEIVAAPLGRVKVRPRGIGLAADPSLP
jgi:hypothetical protein